MLLDVGVSTIERHVLELASVLHRELTALGWPLVTPMDPRRRAGNLSVFARSPETVVEGLAASVNDSAIAQSR